jgi:hypothetical protein
VQSLLPLKHDIHDIWRLNGCPSWHWTADGTLDLAALGDCSLTDDTSRAGMLNDTSRAGMLNDTSRRGADTGRSDDSAVKAAALDSLGYGGASSVCNLDSLGDVGTWMVTQRGEDSGD